MEVTLTDNLLAFVALTIAFSIVVGLLATGGSR